MEELVEPVLDVRDGHVAVVEFSQQRIGDPRGRHVGVEAVGHALVEVRHLPGGGELSGFRRREAVLLAESLAAGVGQFRDLDLLGPLRDPEHGQVGLGEVAVVLLLLLRTHRERDPFALVPVTGLLFHGLPTLERVLLPARLVGQRLLRPSVARDVLDLRPVRRRECLGPNRAVGCDLLVGHQRDVGVDPERAVARAVEDPEVFEDLREFGEEGPDLVRAPEVGFGDDLHQGDPGAVVVDAGVVGGVDAAAGVLEAPRVLFEVSALDGDGAFVVRDGDGEFAVPTERPVVLGDLEVLREVGVVVVLPVKAGFFRHVGVDGGGEFERPLDGGLVEDGQRAGQPEAGRTGV